MTLNALQSLDIIEEMENFLGRIRPSEEIRPQLDYGYKTEDQSIIIFEIRPNYFKPEEILEIPIAKATFVKSKNLWKVFWMRSTMKWENYPPKRQVKTVAAFCKLVEEDDHGCFWG